jgi:enoyl-CoA hydratase/carnithine racemase
MPEITIGLFPDASGSWFLQRMPAHTGLFLGLTGAMCHAGDAIIGNLAEYYAQSGDYESIIERLKAADWRAEMEQGFGGLPSVASRALAAQPATDLPESHLAKYWQTINKLMNSGGLAEIDHLLQNDDALAKIDADFAADKWTQKALATYRHGCPVTAALTYALYYKVSALSLEQVLYLEANVAVHCAANPDFREGVRALLIDKDKAPQWSRTLADCLSAEGQAYIESHFDNPYAPYQHPLQDWLTADALGAQHVR